MAIEIRFNCSKEKSNYLMVSEDSKRVILSGFSEGVKVRYEFDKTTAIKLSKTIRTNINLIK